MINKHAYLIMAHNNWHQLGLLLQLLDDPRNDIFIHIDKRAKDFSGQVEEELKQLVCSSEVVFIDRKNVYWADYSVADVELDLMQTACDKNSYRYYHLLSGMCLLLKTQDEIHSFFENESREFIAMTPNGGGYSEKHTCYYHPFVGNSLYRNHKVIKAADRAVMYIQKALGMKRIYDENLLISTGWQWFSITDGFCRYVLSQRDFIEKMFSYTLDVDEKFIGTMVNKLGNYGELYHVTKCDEGNDSFQKGCMRFIDFDRPVPQPYTWGREDTQIDYETLMNSEFLFARKFNESENAEIIYMIAKKLKPEIQI